VQSWHNPRSFKSLSFGTDVIGRAGFHVMHEHIRHCYLQSIVVCCVPVNLEQQRILA
jgi:hypothetical protein